MEPAGFSDTGMIVFGIALLGLSAVIVVASLVRLLFGRRNRVLGSCGVFFGGALQPGVGAQRCQTARGTGAVRRGQCGRGRSGTGRHATRLTRSSNQDFTMPIGSHDALGQAR